MKEAFARLLLNIKGSVPVWRGGGGRHVYLKETLRFRYIKVYIDMCVVLVRILSWSRASEVNNIKRNNEKLFQNYLKNIF